MFLREPVRRDADRFVAHDADFPEGVTVSQGRFGVYEVLSDRLGGFYGLSAQESSLDRAVLIAQRLAFRWNAPWVVIDWDTLDYWDFRADGSMRHVPGRV